ncbi:hypothetical protein M378DRAFT_27492 [Amanita muscaria Koide BX008]|uniref:Uncharacterized protein n=1 Tax=Amanita muscaria (strain Koide BX008) TaxID=946122 RepID=A0A0C2WQN5_AMAMK|nr:hypothetical protein M378DRAFT_27492 [Amanita muscaria Koide BX008]
MLTAQSCTSRLEPSFGFAIHMVMHILMFCLGHYGKTRRTIHNVMLDRWRPRSLFFSSPSLRKFSMEGLHIRPSYGNCPVRNLHYAKKNVLGPTYIF